MGSSVTSPCSWTSFCSPNAPSCARWNFGNVRCAVDGNENIKPMKNHSIGRIDITVAWIIAMAAAMQRRSAKPDLAQAMRTRRYHL